MAWSRDLKAGGVLPLRWFGLDLVLYRGESGKPYLLDAHCPHLGAHLGRGGCVAEETIVCPFHGWRMSGAGKCVLAPGARKISPRAEVGTWHLRELDGVIFAWVHPDRVAPTWQPDPTRASEGWTRRRHPKSWRMRSHVQEVCENAVDIVHASYLHTHISHGARTLDVETEGPVLRHSVAQNYSAFPLLERMVRSVTGSVQTTLTGLGRIAVAARVDAGDGLEYLVESYPTPVDDDYVEVHVAVSMRKLGSRVLTELLLDKATREAAKTIDQDIAILEHKSYVERPLLVEGEGSIAEYRRWARQFYPRASAAPRAAVEEPVVVVVHRVDGVAVGDDAMVT